MSARVWLKIDFSSFAWIATEYTSHINKYTFLPYAHSFSLSLMLSLAQSQRDYEILIPITTATVQESMRSMRRMRMFLMGLIMLQMACPRLLYVVYNVQTSMLVYFPCSRNNDVENLERERENFRIFVVAGVVVVWVVCQCIEPFARHGRQISW